MQEIIFEETTDDFMNPERGLYENVSLRFTGIPGIADLRENGRTLAHCYIRLDDYIEVDNLPQGFLDELDAGFDRMRNGGVKVLVRPTYNMEHLGNEATKIRMLDHIEQMASLWDANADVIAAHENGYIGAWGSGYYSSSGLDNNVDRRDVWAKILDNFPVNRMLMVRAPYWKYLAFGEQLTSANAFGGSYVARIGHENDAYVHDNWGWPSHDWEQYGRPGSWTDEYLMDFLDEESKYSPVGGESCYFGMHANCSDALYQAEKNRYSYLNYSYHPDVITALESGGCWDTIKAKLGYRLVLKRLLMPEVISPSEVFEFRLELENAGFAAPFNQRSVYLVFKHVESGQSQAVMLDEEIRKWLPGEITIDVRCSAPINLLPGSYELFLWLPDAAESLQDIPEYAIRCANDGVWNEAGMNKLGELSIVDKWELLE